MKTVSVISVAIFFLCISLTVNAQTELSDSKRGSEKAYLYTINKDNLRKIYLKEEGASEDMLERQVAVYTRGADLPVLPRGNYMIVTSEGNELNITDHTVDNLYFKIVPSERMMLCLYDSLGNIIDNATVKCGSKTLHYDKKTKTYNTESVKDEQVLEINNSGVYHYIEIEKQNSYYSAYKRNIFKTAWWKMRGLWFSLKDRVNYIFNPEDRPQRNKYTGFIVFSKPKYKPGETVKLKAYMAGYNGTPYNKPVDIRLSNYYPAKIDTVLTNLSPYRPGMYEYQFKLSDSLNLKLDNGYTVSLETKNKRDNKISASFKYEEYELKSIRFTVNTDKKEYAKGDTVKLKLKVTDESEMAVYDGKVEVLVSPGNFNSEKRRQYSVFIPDTLWSHTIDMSGVSEKEFILPDSIFPAGVSLNYQVMCTYLSADNEKKVQVKDLFRRANDYVIDYTLDKGILTIKELYRGQSQNVAARITASGENDEELLTDSVQLPYSFPVPWMATAVTVKTEHTDGNDYFFLDEDKATDKNQLGYKFYRNNDSIFLKVDNPAKIPFWYSIRKNNSEITKGYTTHLDYSAKDSGKDGYGMQLSYLFGGGEKSIEESLPVVEKNISIDVSTPTSVYPGQKTNVLVSVSDKTGKPVNNVDITAYSFTSKFENYSMPNLPIGGKARYAKRFSNIKYAPDENGLNNRKIDMTWQRWKSTMALDTIEYYKFLYPENYYTYSEPTPDGSTQISPFVVINGALRGIHMLWIDERLYYVNQIQQLDAYTFRITPGKHNLRFRTYDREIRVHNIFVEEGMKNIMSFDASKYVRLNNENDIVPLVISSRELDKKERGYLNDKEVEYLSSQLITIDNNFGHIELPYLSEKVDIPAYINSGNNLYYLNNVTRRNYNYILGGSVNSAILVGPFPARNFMNGMADMASVYAEGKPIVNIGIEGGNRYTLYKDNQKIKSWDSLPFSRNINNFKPAVNFKEQPVTVEKIEESYKNQISNIISGARGAAANQEYKRDLKTYPCRLNLVLGKDVKGSDVRPSFIFIVPENKEDIADYRLYYGGTRDFRNLLAGSMNVTLVFKDSTVYSKTITLKPNGQNYLRIDSVEYERNEKIAATAFRMFNRNIKKVQPANPYVFANRKDSVVMIPPQKTTYYKHDNIGSGVISGIVRDASGEPLIGVSVVIEGTKNGTMTDLDGHFELSGNSGDKINIAYIGYIGQTEKFSEGSYYDIVLKESEKALSEVVVIGYGTQMKTNLTGSVSVVQSNYLGYFDNQVLQGRVAGIMIRGAGSVNQSEPPLILVNGLPFNGKLEDIDASTITSLNVLKDASATALYGSRAANGVIMIQTNTLNTTAQQSDDDKKFAAEAGNTMRKNFHDDAFWQPRLKTNEKGEASFEVTYPDDITSWNAYFIAVGSKKQTDKKQMTVKSFKALTARLSTPRFAVRGDSLNLVGRVANHFGDSISVMRKIKTLGHVSENDMRIASSYVDYIPVKAESGDSITVAYSLQMPNGYFDGEERSMPIFEQGMLQTYGDFKLIGDTLTHPLNINPELGDVTIHAEASSLELFLREIDKVDRYPYMCNEQMASKIKVLLSKKQIAQIFGNEFKEDKKINDLISRLNKNKNDESLWGWWNRDKTEFWISKQIINTMLDAADAGYKTDFDTHILSQVFEQELKNGLSALQNTTPDRIPFGKQELLDRLVFLKRMKAPVDYQAYFKQIDAQLKSRTFTDKLKTALAMSYIGLKDEIVIDSLMKYSNKTMLGSLYWGNQKEDVYPRYFVLPYENNTENTLTAYDILKNIGGHEKELEKIRNYFFERRQGGSWSNTYESSRIIETIMPDMLKPGEKYREVTMFVNDKTISKFPYTDKINTQESVRVRKTGTAPLFVTAYQQEWNKNPEIEVSKGFAVKSYFTANKDTVSLLTAGKTVQLEALVTLNADAEYVQIEVPIPAGCTYETKGKGSFWKEVHREYFKDKVVIFCNKLHKGEHKFTIELIPRYTGLYSLNPAKAELMYFPTFYGNETLKRVIIKE